MKQYRRFLKAPSPLNENEKQQQFDKLRQKIIEKTQNHQLRIDLVQQKIDNKMLVTYEKYVVRKAKNQQRFHYKLTATEVYYQRKIAQLVRKCQKRQSVKPKYYHYFLQKFAAKKQIIVQFCQTDKHSLQQQFQANDAALERWLHEKFKDCQWDFHNFALNFQKHREDYYANNIYKINYFYDKRFFYYQYYQQRKWLKTVKNQFAHQATVRKECVRRKNHLTFDLVNRYHLKYLPFSYLIHQKIQALNNYCNLIPLKIKNKFHDLSYVTLKDCLKLRWFGIPILVYLTSLVIMILALAFQLLAAETMGAMALLFVIAICGGELLNRLPIWRTFLGGGTMGVFFIGAILGTFNLIPFEVVNQVKAWFVTGGFLNLYINILIVGSILTIHQKLIVKSLSGFICLLFSAMTIAVMMAYLFSNIFALPWKQTVLEIILPLLSDGNGGGVQPLSAMSAEYHYLPYHHYMSFALAVSTVSNVFVIIIAAILTTILSKSPTWSGYGKLMKKPIYLRSQVKQADDRQVAAALFLSCMIYVCAKMLETVVLKLTGININAFAWTVVLALVLNLSNFLPNELQAGFYRLNQFFSHQFTWFLMAGIGLTMTNLKIFISLFINWKALLLILIIDLSLVIGPLLIARLIKFYALESMIAAGCCLGAQGGAGSLAVLGTAKRLELLPYSQITCRIGGGLVLIVAAPIFLWFQPLAVSH